MLSFFLCSAGSVELAHCGFCFCQQEFFQYYIESNGSRPSADEENKMDLLRKGTYSILTGLQALQLVMHTFFIEIIPGNCT